MSETIFAIPCLGGPLHGAVEHLADPPEVLTTIRELTPTALSLNGGLTYRIDNAVRYRLRRWGEGGEARYYYEYEGESMA